MRKLLHKACESSSKALFEGMSKIRKPGDDDYGENLEMVHACAQDVEEYLTKVAKRIKTVNLVSAGDAAPTALIKASKFNNADAWKS